MFFTFIVLIQDYFGYVYLVIEFLLPANLQHDHVGRKPHDPILARKGVSCILVTVAVDVVLHLFHLEDDLAVRRR